MFLKDDRENSRFVGWREWFSWEGKVNNVGYRGDSGWRDVFIKGKL